MSANKLVLFCQVTYVTVMTANVINFSPFLVDVVVLNYSFYLVFQLSCSKFALKEK